MPYCAHCGTQLAEGAANCTNCGRPQQPQQTYAAPYAASARTDGQAVASLILGIAGLVVCPLIPSIIAIVLGNQAQARMAMDPDLGGEGLARAGIILGWIGVGIAALGLIAAFAGFFSFGFWGR